MPARNGATSETSDRPADVTDGVTRPARRYGRRPVLQAVAAVVVGGTQVSTAESTSGEDEHWQFDTDGQNWSSPTAVDGALFVGSGDVHALDAGVDGSSAGSRVALGTLGHHHERAADAASNWWDSYTDAEGVASSAGDHVLPAINDFEATGEPGAGQVVTLIQSFETGTPVPELTSG